MARDDLLRMLEPLQARENCLLTVVFDGRGGKTTLTKHHGNEEYSIIYSSSSQGADGVIEKMMVMSAEFPERITVGTNDNLIRNCAYTHGAAVMRVQEIIKKLDASIELSKNMRGKVEKIDQRFENRIPFPDE